MSLIAFAIMLLRTANGDVIATRQIILWAFMYVTESYYILFRLTIGIEFLNNKSKYNRRM